MGHRKQTTYTQEFKREALALAGPVLAAIEGGEGALGCFVSIALQAAANVFNVD